MLPPHCFCCWGLGAEMPSREGTLIFPLRCFELFSVTAWRLGLKHCQAPEEAILSEKISPITGMHVAYKTDI